MTYGTLDQFLPSNCIFTSPCSANKALLSLDSAAGLKGGMFLTISSVAFLNFYGYPASCLKLISLFFF
jgi:hypothetical protein